MNIKVNNHSASCELFIQKKIAIFDNQLSWNSILLWIQRSSSFIIFIFLFKRLSVNDFSLLTNGMSLVFLLLLWIDGGFRKAIPHYALTFLTNPLQNRIFIISVIGTQSILLILMSPFLLFMLLRINTDFGHSYLKITFLLFFITEGILSTIKFLYHGYLWHKFFVIASSIALLIESLATLSYLLLTCSSWSLLMLLMTTKLCISGALTCFSIYYLHYLFKNHARTHKTIIKSFSFSSCSISLKNFFYHAAILWFFSLLKSLTERNFLVPLVTLLTGQAHGNNFKVAQETALFLQRIILKTIGTADTSFFSALRLQQPSDSSISKVISYGIQHVTKRTTQLIIGLLGIMIIFYFLPSFYFGSYSLPSSSFLLASITTLYLSEVLLLPYERILEVNFLYRSLIIAYAPYSLSIALIALVIIFTSQIGWSLEILLSMLLIIMVIRLLSLLLMRSIAKRYINSLS